MSSKKSSQAQPLQLAPGNPRDTSGKAIAATAPTRPAPPPPDPEMSFDCPPWPPQIPEVAAELTAMIASGTWGRYQSETLRRLRDQMASDLGVRHVRLVCSGSAAIELALRACGVGADRRPPANVAGQAGSGDLPQEVICPALDYPGNVRAIRLLGAIPILVDTVPGGWTLDPDAVLAAATPRTVAVIASHLYGEIAAVQTLREICDRRRWALIEDVCQMPGGTLNGRPLGSFGHAAAWSFGGSKPLTAGCGGAITSDDDRLAQRLAAHADRPSDAFPLSPLQAAVLIPQWAALTEFGSRQRARLRRLMEACRDQTPRWQWPPDSPPQHRAVYYKVPIVIQPEPLAPQAPPSSAQASSAQSPSSGPADAGTAQADAGTADPLARLMEAAQACGIPVGEAFRIPERMARSRGRISSAANARAITARTWLIDHRALAGDEASVEQLARLLIGLHRRT